MSTRKLRSVRAFTLIELLVVLAVVATLLSIALPRYFGSLDKARDIALQENLRVIRSSLDKFRADRGRWPDSLEELVNLQYLGILPKDPVTESSSTWVLVTATADGERGISDVKSGAPGIDRQGTQYGGY